jgi:predicted neuraminidase
MNSRRRLVWGLLFCCVLLAADVLRRAPGLSANPLPAPRAVMASSFDAAGPGRLMQTAQGHIPMPADTPSAHASNLLAMPPGHACAVLAFWFAGTRESAPDVQLASACFERASQQWSAAKFIVNRHDFSEQLGYGLRRLGNPVAWLDAQGKVHLYVVTTGLGGWAAARILHLQQMDGGKEFSSLSFGQPRVLPLSWLWNTSFLVRGAPLPLEDGGMVLPVYFELGIKFPAALRFDAQGNFLGLTRISTHKSILQPTLMAMNATHWLALMRDNRIDGHIAVAQTGDGGQTWRDLRDLTLSNPDASIFAMPLGPWHFALAHNSSKQTRQVLDLSESGNGIDWVRSLNLATGTTVGEGAQAKLAEYSYPAMAVADGSLWVTYTDGRERIAWQRFEWKATP